MAVHTPDRRAVLQGLAGLAASPLAAAAQPLGASFLALGDWGRDGGRHQLAVASAMGVAAAELGSRFVIAAGDNFYPGGVTSPADPRWKSSFEDVYTAPGLQTPWYAALGNHDYRGDPHAQVVYGRDNPRWRMPHRYYAVPAADLGVPGLDLFVIDTTPLLANYDERVMELLKGRFPHQNPRRQLKWLDRALRQSDAPWKVVVGHHPIFSGGHHGDTPELAARLNPLLEAHGVQAYICGHDHVLQHIRRGVVDYVCTGAGASAGTVEDVPGTLFKHGHPGFAAFRCEPDRLRVAFRGADGATVYEGVIPRRLA